MGKSIYLTDKEIEALIDATDFIDNKIDGATDEEHERHASTIHQLQRIFSKARPSSTFSKVFKEKFLKK